MSTNIYRYDRRLKSSIIIKFKNVKVAMTTGLATALIIAGIALPIAAVNAQGGQTRTGVDAVPVAGTTVTTADLQITGSASTGSPAPGSSYTYTFQIKNSGGATATDVVFTSPTPSNVTPNFATLNNSTLPCFNVASSVNGGSSVQCNVGSLAKGGNATVVVAVSAPQVASTVTTTGSVSASTVDPVLTNNSATVNVTIKAPTGGVCKGGTCDTVPTAIAAPCAVLTSATAPVGYYLIYAAIWNDFTVQSCSQSIQTVNIEISETNLSTGNVDYFVPWAVTLVPGQNFSMVLDNDFAAYSTNYRIDYTVKDQSGNVLSTASTTATTPPQL